MNSDGDAPRAAEKRFARYGKPAALVLLIVLIAGTLGFIDAPARLQQALETVHDLGWMGYAIFCLLYIAACVLFIPGTILTLGGGAIFGLARGVICVSAASTLGAGCAFLVGRFLAREFVARKLERYPRFVEVDRAVAREGWKIVFLTRLSPIFPFNLLNYAFGLTQVSFSDYFIASWAGMLPGTILYVYLGTLAGDLVSLGASERSRSPLEWAFLLVGLLATIAVTVFITRIARKALQTKTG